MRQNLLAIVCIFFCTHAFARDQHQVSSVRLKGESWIKALKRVHANSPIGKQSFQTPLSTAVTLEKLDPNLALAFQDSASRFQRNFEYLRDDRFLSDPNKDDFNRRLSWMYPDDGCFIRAEWMAKKFEMNFHSKSISKIFAFGDLSVKTMNSVDGQVSWWYHVVVGFRIDRRIFVYDPSIEARAPMELIDWVKTMSSDPNQVKIAICERGAYQPNSECSNTELLSDDEANSNIQDFLSAERDRLSDLDRDIDAELGINPPWLH